MRLLVIAVSARQPAWIEAGFEEYARRMPREARIELIRIKPERRTSQASDERLLAGEAVRITAALPRASLRIVLDERGDSIDTALFARRMQSWMSAGREVAFLIGGADGLARSVKDSADAALSLSPMTLPHGLARVLLAEQLYRAVSILQHHPYHRA
jgi:23S rRNA (pseudouridine1915-N3)-methyltransferase